jgi:hypothetical protein
MKGVNAKYRQMLVDLLKDEPWWDEYGEQEMDEIEKDILKMSHIEFIGGTLMDMVMACSKRRQVAYMHAING